MITTTKNRVMDRNQLPFQTCSVHQHRTKQQYQVRLLSNQRNDPSRTPSNQQLSLPPREVTQPPLERSCPKYYVATDPIFWWRPVLVTYPPRQNRNPTCHIITVDNRKMNICDDGGRHGHSSSTFGINATRRIFIFLLHAIDYH